MIRLKKANTMVEYAVVLGIITTTVMLMQAYLKRGIQGTIKATADQLGWPAALYYIGEKGINVTPQPLGVWEKGLFTYKNKDGSAKVTQSLTVDTEINLKEKPPQAGQPIRTVDIIKDQTKTSGEWQITSSLDDEGTFSTASLKKKPSEGVSAQAKEPIQGSGGN